MLAQRGGIIKRLSFKEHQLREGALVTIPSSFVDLEMMGLIKCIPTGLIVTTGLVVTDKKHIQFEANATSVIPKNHFPNLPGFIDVEVVRLGEDGWREHGDPLSQSFAVTDLKVCDEIAEAKFMPVALSVVALNVKEEIAALMQKVNVELRNIRRGMAEEMGKSEKEMLDSASSSVKSVSVLLSKFRSEKRMTGHDVEFGKQVGRQITAWNREIRARRFEISMTFSDLTRSNSEPL